MTCQEPRDGASCSVLFWKLLSHHSSYSQHVYHTGLRKNMNMPSTMSPPHPRRPTGELPIPKHLVTQTPRRHRSTRSTTHRRQGLQPCECPPPWQTLSHACCHCFPSLLQQHSGLCRYNTDQFSPYAAPSPQGSYQPSPSPQSYHQVAPSPAGYQNTHSPASYHPTPSPMAYQVPVTHVPWSGAAPGGPEAQDDHCPLDAMPPFLLQASPSPSPVGYSPMTPGAPSPGGYNPHTPGSGIEQNSSDWVTTDIQVKVRDTHLDTQVVGQMGVIRSVTVRGWAHGGGKAGPSSLLILSLCVCVRVCARPFLDTYGYPFVK